MRQLDFLIDLTKLGFARLPICALSRLETDDTLFVAIFGNKSLPELALTVSLANALDFLYH